MADRRAPSTTSSVTSTRPSGISVRRNLFNQHLSRRPTTNSNSTSSETLRLDSNDRENLSHSSLSSQTSEIVSRDHNGDYELGDPSMNIAQGTQEEGDMEDGIDVREEEFAKERQRLADAVKLHQRDINRAPSEPAELLEAVKASLRYKVAALAEDNWMYEPEEDLPAR